MPDTFRILELTRHTRTWVLGIEKCWFHDLRHTFISNLIVEEKEDFTTLMELSGHKNITMLRRYSHTQEEAKKTAIEKLGNPLKNIGMDTYLDIKTLKKSIQVVVSP